MDFSSDNRTTQESINEIEEMLHVALEQAALGWTALGKETAIARPDRDRWPLEVQAPVVSVPYHLEAMIEAILRCYAIVREEQDKLNGC